ncbi:MAG: hypothetical protein CL609_10660 [Anaerolineaceae bacterium]|nr:hypothetical protein [Anaerolineaceae bacterium]
MNRKIMSVFALLAVFALAFTSTLPAAANPGGGDRAGKFQEEFTDGVYLVQLVDAPVVAYEGGIAGFKATKPAKGEKINPNKQDVIKYVGYLDGNHNDVLQRAGGKKLYDYRYTFNGFAAELTAPQAAKIASLPEVVSIERDQLMQMDTATTPDFLGLTAEGGLWDQLGGVGASGEDVIIGIVDSGIWPESMSFSDRTGTNGNNTQGGKLDYQQIPGWHGKCTPGEAFPASLCNQKLIGAQYFNSGWGGNGGIDAQFPNDFNSPRDGDGHGTHTASTAGGNFGVEATGPAALFGSVSGMAPRARIATYKVCWGGADGGCFGADSVAAIDQAVADGVDVINFSISGTSTNFLDAVEVAFLYAADAGVFVAASAGNNGPGASSVAHPSPWITTVAAGTHDRSLDGMVTLGDGSVFYGPSAAAYEVSANLVYSADVGLSGEDPTEVRLCYPGTLDPALVSGKIVACDRGVIARVDKSLAVMEADGVGMILMNTGPSSLNGDLHFVPTVHVSHLDRPAILAYITAMGADATATIAEGTLNFSAPAPYIASFSSRGPLLATGDLLKPDITAPGVDILAAVAPPFNSGREFDLYSGTSMSSPHIAGLAALMKQAHPDWSVAMIKSAMMTTAYDLLGDDNPFSQGAGHVQPNVMVDPGLVYDNGWVDWLGFLCGTGQLAASYCPSIEIDPSDLNLASIAIGELAGEQVITRTVTNVGHSGEHYAFSYDLPGVEVTADPASFMVSPGASQTFTLTFTVVDEAYLDMYTNGHVTWTGDQGHVVRSPVVVKPVKLAAPAEVVGTGTEGMTSFDISFGYSGVYTSGAHGLVAATETLGNVLDDPTNTFVPGGPGTTLHFINIPADTAYARFSLFDDYTDGADDLDLYVYYPNGTFAGGSGSGTSAEQVDVPFPMAGDYYVFVHGWQTDGADANYTLFSWAVPAAVGSTNMTVSGPTDAVLGATETVMVDWFGLDPGKKYLGAVSHNDASTILGLTLIAVSTE